MTELLAPPNSIAPTTPSPPAARDFSRARKRLTFTIDSDTFEAASALPGDIYAEFVTLYNGTGDVEAYQQQHDLLKSALELALLPDSYQRFTDRLKNKTNPIDDDQLADVVLWLLEEYGMRPTEPSQPFSDGPPSPEPGISSTANTQPEESTSQPSLPIAS